MDIRPHERFSDRVTLTREQISSFAYAAGDLNPIHHDIDAASRSRWGGIIASGPHTASLLMGLTATHFSRAEQMVGLEFSFRFRAPVPADQPLDLEWMVVRVRETRRLGGRLIDLRGRLRTPDGKTAVGAKGLVLVG